MLEKGNDELFKNCRCCRSSTPKFNSLLRKYISKSSNSYIKPFLLMIRKLSSYFVLVEVSPYILFIK